MNRSLRQGSIPLVLLVVVVLAIGAGASLYTSQSDARLRKRVELGALAQGFAKAAIEEVVAQVVNGTATVAAPRNGQGVVLEAVPQVTTAFAADQGITVSPVTLMGRVVVPPTQGDADARQRFDELLTAGANFAPTSVRERVGEPTADYRTDDRPAWADHPALAHLTKAPEGAGADFVEAYLEAGLEQDPSEDHDGGALRASLAEIEPLSPLEDWKTDDTNFLSVRHTDDELETFQTVFTKAMEDVSEVAADEAAGSGGGCGSSGSDSGSADADAGTTIMTGADPTSIDIESGSGSSGSGAEPSGSPSEDIANGADAAGAQEEQTMLVTLQSTASTEMMRVGKRVSEYRLIETSQGTPVLDGLGDSTVGHLMAYYNITPADTVELGWCEELDQDGDGVPDPLRCDPRKVLAGAYRDIPEVSVQVAGFPSVQDTGL